MKLIDNVCRMHPDIIFEDNHLLAVNKPSGYPTQPDQVSNDSLQDFYKQWIKQRDHKAGNVFLEVVHRLDKPVTGVVVFAKTSKALSRLQASMRSKSVIRKYHAMISRPLPSDEGTLVHYLIHREYYAEIASPNNPEAKKAILHYQTIGKCKDKIVLEITLETGRYHQIRAQLSAAGSPIINDVKYGGATDTTIKGVALHHACFGIPHPITHEMQLFQAVCPFVLD